MGMFDSILFDCPNCGNKIEDQSKAGDCNLDYYNQDEAPAIIAADCLGDRVVCQKCKKHYEVTTPWVFIPLTLTEITD